VTRATLVILLALGCGSPAKPVDKPTVTDAQPATAEGDPTCPLLVPGTSISVEDTDKGPAFVFVTTGDVAAVRAKGKELVATYNGGRDGSGNGNYLALMIGGPAATASATDIEGGVRVTFSPTDPATTAAMADELRMHGQHLSGASSCKMHH
jgi:hypothetical protein